MSLTESPLLPVYSPPEQVFVRGEGVHLYAKTGDRYLDFIAGISVNAFGHAHPRMVETLREQAVMTGNHGLERQAEQLVSPRLLRVLEADESRKRLYRRLDFLRNGVGYTDSGVASSVAGELTTGTAEAPKGGLFSPEQMQRMKEIMLEPAEMVRIFQAIIARAGMLSSEDASTWSSSRTHRAADGLFQVVINPAKTTFEVDSTSGIFKVASAPRSLYDVMIVGGFHELEHINQATADEAVGQTVKIAKIKGKRVSGLREVGANVRQRSGDNLGLKSVAEIAALIRADAEEPFKQGGMRYSFA